MTSIRGRLLVNLSLVFLVLYALSGVLLYAYLNHVLWKGFDAALLEKAETFARTTEAHDNDVLEFEFLESDLPEYWPQRRAEYFQVWRTDGTVVARSPSLGSNNLPVPSLDAAYPAFSRLTLPDGRKGGAVTLDFHPRPGTEILTAKKAETERLYVVLAISSDIVDKTLAKIRTGLLITCLAFIAGSLPSVWWSIWDGLRALDLVGQQVQGVNADNLTFRFGAEGLPVELAPVCERLNDLLGRLDDAFKRERRFTANAAHELRTPIAELRTLAEVGLGEAQDSAPSMKEYFVDALGVAKQLEHLIETLLLMARCDAGMQVVDWQWTDIAAQLRESWEQLCAHPDGHAVAAAAIIPAHAMIQTDPTLFRALVANLLDNALAYTPGGGAIHLTLVLDSTKFRLTIANTSSELKAADVCHIFEPFWRKTNPQKQEETHCGMGLSLVATYAKLLGLVLHAGLVSPSTLEINVSGTLERETSGPSPA